MEDKIILVNSDLVSLSYAIFGIFLNIHSSITGALQICINIYILITAI